VLTKLWDPEARFFKVLPRGKTTLADVRGLHGYTPWYFDLPEPAMSVAWRELMDSNGFYTLRSVPQLPNNDTRLSQSPTQGTNASGTARVGLWQPL